MAHLVTESKVLVIYSGGTIGMLIGDKGLVTEPSFLTDTLRSQYRFHDPGQDSLFSNVHSVEKYRAWSGGRSRSRSGRASPAYMPEGSVNSGAQSVDLLVKSSRPIGKLPSSLSPHTTHDHTKTSSHGVYEASLPSLVTPASSVPGQAQPKRIRYAILEWNPLLDSSNVEIDDWISIASDIELNYNTFDGFVVLHGTDTMAYSSSALSFLLERLGKTVIITGAQISLSQLRNDAVDNLLGALLIAGHYTIPECCLYFNHTLFRGNRVTKTSSNDLNAFSSPNFAPLVNVGIDIVVNWNDVIRDMSMQRFTAHKSMNPHVVTLRIFPGITAATIKALLASPTCGVVLEVFGAGNAPNRPDLLEALREACARGVVIVAISQCAKGAVTVAYETGRMLQDCGVVSGSDMTPECALTKLGYLLSKPELSISDVRRMIGVSLRGELTRFVKPAVRSPDHHGKSLDNIMAQILRFSAPILSQQGTAPRSSAEPDEAQAAPWSLTATESAATQSVLIPFLVHLAVSRDDLDGLKRSLESAKDLPNETSLPHGFLDCLDCGSGRTPLHVAALNGSVRCAEYLLEKGALVHPRDLLDHTALYYAQRQGHGSIARAMIQAGAHLGGRDRTEYQSW